ncbi:MAG: 3-oxoacyl-[acyl-carrier-protein] synthase 3 [Atribacteria bacterium 34_128]|jgi:3-oxoacyl-[acyl-carrier-protein] synthase-3|nr:MAG: 3-oxoacyl-[acyl-carrier-protein] synthase 3 [Atribacteria bacterium 34_128]
MKNMQNVKIIGTGSYVPTKVLTNEDLEKIVDTNNEWIITRTGIAERRLAKDNEITSDISSRAAMEALKDANIKPAEIDLIIVASNSPDMVFPATACLVQEKINAVNAATFDLQAGCTGSVYALITAWQFISNGFYNNALIIGAETLSKFVDWTDRNTCILFGDGAAAVVLKAGQEKGILSGYLGGDGSKADLIMLPGGLSRNPASHKTVEKKMHYVKMKGNEVFKHAVRNMKRSTIKALEKCHLSVKDIDCFIPHQANIRIISAVSRVLGIKEDKVFINLSKYGNTSAASVVIALDEAAKEGTIKNDDIVVLTSFGAGLTYGSIVFRWNK